MTDQKQRVRIGTRKSPLALAQTQLVIDWLSRGRPDLEIEVIAMSTQGDRNLEQSLQQIGGKGVFVGEFESALLEGRIDLAVHSAKDLPMELAPGLAMAAVSVREDERDVLVVRADQADLLDPAHPEHAQFFRKPLGTSSLRREIQLKALFSDAQFAPVRGNVGTRLHKLANGDFSGLILAAAGLKRLGFLSGQPGPGGWESVGCKDLAVPLLARYLSFDQCLPAAGQGFLALETRSDDCELRSILQEQVNDFAAEICLLAERSCVRTLAGGCNAPLAMRCTYDASTRLLELQLLDGRRVTGRGMDKQERWDMGQIRQVQFSAILAGPEQAAEATARASEWARTLPQGRVDLIGAGPGNIDLITLQGKKCLEQADVIVYDRLASPGFLGLVPSNAELYPVGKKAGEHTLPQDQINELLVALARQGKRVARLKGGDPFVFGRGGEEALHLKAHGIPFSIVPGITSAVAVPAYAGIPVTHRGYSASFLVISGHDSNSGDLKLDFNQLARSDGSLVCLMGLKSLPQLCQGLIAAGLDPEAPAATIQSGATDRQRLVTATVRDLPAAVAQANLQSPAITVIGPAVALAPDLAWFEPGPLQGRRIVLTRARNKRTTSDWAARIQDLGGEPVELDLIRIVSLAGTPQVTSAMQQLKDFSWLVLTSAAGVETFMAALRLANQDIRSLAHCRIAAIGPATADALLSYGLRTDYLPEIFTSEALTEGLLPFLQPTDQVLVFTAAAGSSQLADTLLEHHIPCQSVAAYQTEAIPAHAQALLQNLDRIDAITLASASAVHALADGIAASGLMTLEQFLAHQIPLYCIGPMTAQACELRGLPVRATAREASFEQLIQLILSDDIAHSTGDER